MQHAPDQKILPAPATTTVPAVTWTISGAAGEAEREQASEAITAVLRRHRRAVDHVRVRVTGDPDVVQINLRVCGAPARTQAAGRTMATAIAHAAARLDRHIARLTTAWQPWPWPDPQRRPLASPEAAPIGRLKSFRLHTGMPCQAAAFMNAMDYDVFLYTDGETGEDAVVYRAGPTGLSIARQKTMRPPSMPTLLPIAVNPRKIPTLTPGQAAARLAEFWLPYVFYTDHRTRRGNLLYRRYDGSLGLIAPVAPTALGEAS